jgi:hypothetical protein
MLLASAFLTEDKYSSPGHPVAAASNFNFSMGERQIVS